MADPRNTRQGDPLPDAPGEEARSVPYLVLKALASLWLTVVLLALCIVLVFVGSLAQIHMDIQTTQKTFFYTWLVLTPSFPIPFPGGFTLGTLLLINLLAAHVMRFSFRPERIGLLLTHLGLIVLLVGGLLTALFQVESNLTLNVGETRNYTESPTEYELAIAWPSKKKGLDHVVAIPQWMVENRDPISYPGLPFTLHIDRWYENSTLLGPMQANGLKPQATEGIGAKLVVERELPGGATDPTNMPSAVVRVRTLEGKDLGSWLLTSFIPSPQEVQVDGKPYYPTLRHRRFYKPFSIKLLTFIHKQYHGVDIPKRFESRVQLIDPARGIDRPQRIYMNHPLRYGGKTFYQASFGKGDRLSVFQVVQNPGWLIPYLSCALVALGLALHFGRKLAASLKEAR